ncbi:hypothetical protein Ocin01_06953, partial [Orchesella cincta]
SSGSVIGKSGDSATNFKVGKDDKTLVSRISESSGSSSGASKRNNISSLSNSTSSSSINFQPGACSTFILTEGEEFPEDIIAKERGAGGGNTNFHGRRNKSSIETSGSSSSDKYAEPINNGVGSSSSKSSRMKVESQQLSPDGAALPIPETGSPNGIHSNNISGEEENFECFGEGSESFTLETGSGDTSLQFSSTTLTVDEKSIFVLDVGGGVGGKSECDTKELSAVLYKVLPLH